MRCLKHLVSHGSDIAPGFFFMINIADKFYKQWMHKLHMMEHKLFKQRQFIPLKKMTPLFKNATNCTQLKTIVVRTE